MIKGVGTQRAISSWIPLVAVAGYRAQTQAKELIANRKNYIKRLDITETDFDNFLMNWAAPLSEIENYPSESTKHQCNCRGGESKRGYEEQFAILNLIDLLDIVYNVGFTEYLFDGVTTRYKDEGTPRILQCLSCLGTFTGISFTSQWDDLDFDDRKPSPTLHLIAEGIPLNPFTEEWVLSDWKLFGDMLHTSTGFSNNHFFQILTDMVDGIIDINPAIGSNWMSPATIVSVESKHITERFNKWVNNGADYETAMMGVILETVTMQKKSIPAPTTEIIATVMNPVTRYPLVQYVDTYVNDLIPAPQKWNDRQTGLAFNVIVNMSKNDIDRNLLKAMLDNQ